MPTLNDIKKLTQKYEDKNASIINAAYKEIAALINKYYTELAYLAAKKNLINGNLPKALQSKITSLITTLNEEIEAKLQKAIVKSWALSEQKGEIIEDYVEQGGSMKIPPTIDIALSDNLEENYSMIAKRYGGGSQEALKSFIERKENGLNLSQLIYKQGEETQSFIEETLTEGIGNGTSARDMAKDLINAVNTEAKGQGIYKDPKKNALRLSSNEINTAYRTADYYRNQGKWYITGIVVHLSKRERKCDMCNYLQGTYPKDFKFTKWHINCRCYTTTLLATKEEIKQMDLFRAGKADKQPNIKYVDSIPQTAKDWVANNLKKIQGWKNLPDFLQDNKDYF